MMFGDDFAHPQSEKSYMLMDLVIDAKVKAKYSRVGEFVDSLKKHKEWPVFRDDLFPYLTDQGEYWSGYYSTNVQFKMRVRQLATFVHSKANLNALQSSQTDNLTTENLMNLSVLFHHDAITGTH